MVEVHFKTGRHKRPKVKFRLEHFLLVYEWHSYFFFAQEDDNSGNSCNYTPGQSNGGGEYHLSTGHPSYPLLLKHMHVFHVEKYKQG